MSTDHFVNARRPNPTLRVYLSILKHHLELFPGLRWREDTKRDRSNLWRLMQKNPIKYTIAWPYFAFIKAAILSYEMALRNRMIPLNYEVKFWKNIFIKKWNLQWYLRKKWGDQFMKKSYKLYLLFLIVLDLKQYFKTGVDCNF